MRSAVLAKSVSGLTRRRGRTAVSVATLGLAVASLGIFAVTPLMDDRMASEVARNRLADLTVDIRPQPVDAAVLARLRALPNVAAVEPRSAFTTRVYAGGGRRERALLVGVPDFRRQQADVVRVTSGAAPSAPGTALTEVQNARQGRFDGGRGDVARVIGADGRTRALRLTGEGRNLGGAQAVTGDDKAVVFYTTPATVAAVRGSPGATSLAFRLRDASPPAARRTLAAVRDVLRAGLPGFTGFSTLPDVRAPGDWPGKAIFEDFGTLFLIVTALALLSGLVLISGTMNAMVAEEAGEIATMRAVGARRRQVAAVYLRTALLLGALGAAVGVPLGVLLANAMVAFFGSSFFAIDAGFGVSWPWVAASAVLGIAGPALAALPAVRRGVRRPLQETLAAAGLPAAPTGALDRLLLRARLPRTAQIGLRSAARRRRRALGTVVIVALAVGNLLGIMALATGVTEVTRAEWDTRDWQITLGSNLRRPLDARAERAVRAVPGVAGFERAFSNAVELRGRDAFLYGIGPGTRFRYRMDAGRWPSDAEQAAGARVVVLERGIARAEGIGVGDRVRLATGAGRPDLRVIGIAGNQQENGSVAFVPLATARAVLGVPQGVNQLWIRTTSPDHALIDRTTTAVEDALVARGYEVGTEITYVGKRDNVEANQVLTTSIAVLGFLVVAISMVGLVNAITTSMLERTREIGILRCIGARGRDVRRIFATEGLVLAVLGWLAGIPLGYLVLRVLVRLIRELLDVDVPVVYPAAHIAVALAGTVLLALAVLALPLRRAVRLRPGDALRYA